MLTIWNINDFQKHKGKKVLLFFEYAYERVTTWTEIVGLLLPKKNADVTHDWAEDKGDIWRYGYHYV